MLAAPAKRLAFWLHGPLLPLLVLQGRRTRARLPVLPEASGARRGRVGAGRERLAIAVLGESTAVGVGAATQGEALAFCLARSLARSRGVAVDVQAVGRSGANVSTVGRELASGIAHPVDAVLVVLGVNDTLELTRGARWTSALGALIRDLRLRGALRVLFSGVPPLGELRSLPQPTRSALGARAAYLDRLLARVCASEGAAHLPTHFPFDPDLFARTASIRRHAATRCGPTRSRRRGPSEGRQSSRSSGSRPS